MIDDPKYSDRPVWANNTDLVQNTDKVYQPFGYSNTVCLYSQRNRIMFYSTTNHWVELCDADCCRFMMSSFLTHRPCFLDNRWCNIIFVNYKHKKYM